MKNSKNSVFLMELILVILIFSLASTVCVQIFVKACSISKETETLNNSVSICSSAAELFYGYKGSLSSIQNEIDSHNYSVADNGMIKFYYNDKYKLCHSYEGEYVMNMSVYMMGNFKICNINFFRLSDNTEIYKIECSMYIPKEN